MSAEGPSTPTVVGLVDLDDGEDPIDLDRWVALATDTLALQNVVGPAELSLHFVSVQAMTELNMEHMEGSGPTDVLAFPLDAFADPDMADLPRLLGDIVVCPTVAAENARRQDGELNDELALLVVHGLLHILGHDHAEPEETKMMKEQEVQMLQALHTAEGTAHR